MVAACAAAVALRVTATRALTINPSFDTTITTNSNATYFESQINSAISAIDSYIANPVTINITFQGVTTGLGSNLVSNGANVSYSAYLSALKTRQTLSAADTSALASLPSNFPVPGDTPANPNAQIGLTGPLALALGLAQNPSGGTVYANLGSMILPQYSPAQNAYRYSMQSVVAHEIDEILGIGGDGSNLNDISYGFSGTLTDSEVGPLDLFRYSADGVRSFTTASTATAYFSINGGKTNLVNFNQNSNGDYGDWTGTSQVQNWSGTPGQVLNLGANEMTALDVVGWNLTAAGTALETGQPVPETATLPILSGALALILLPRRQRRSLAQRWPTLPEDTPFSGHSLIAPVR